jgi:hypothetical protein
VIAQVSEVSFLGSLIRFFFFFFCALVLIDIDVIRAIAERRIQRGVYGRMKVESSKQCDRTTTLW